MIIGSGLLANAFLKSPLNIENVTIYAAGVSNSNCSDESEFKREHLRLVEALKKSPKNNVFIYFGTCSVYDPLVFKTPYVIHKLEMEKIVHSHHSYHIFRLPQVAGETSNPHTLLNFLYARISRSEKFNLWENAERNIIDVKDVVSIILHLTSRKFIQNTTINIANIINYRMIDIVCVMETEIGKRAIYDLVEKGSEYIIDVSDISHVLANAGVDFGENYLKNVISKYY